MNTIITTDITIAKEHLLLGEPVAIPTETVYGLAANALNADAVSRIFEAKQRPLFDPLIVHLSGPEQMEKYGTDIPEKAKMLANAFWPGPLTIVVKRSAIIPDLVTSGMDTVGLRVPNHPLALRLLKELDFPLAAPSANPFGYISPTSARHVYDQLRGHIPVILDGGPCAVGVESTIVHCTDDHVEILRLGGIDVESIVNVVGHVHVQTHSSSNPKAPGMLESHYAPRKKLILTDVDTYVNGIDMTRVGVLSFSQKRDVPIQRILSIGGDLRIAAQNLFSMMRELDGEDVDYLIGELAPEEGLGLAINDRLRRAGIIEA